MGSKKGSFNNFKEREPKEEKKEYQTSRLKKYKITNRLINMVSG